MKNWQKGGMILLLCIALSGCKSWNCGCPMSGVEVDEATRLRQDKFEDQLFKVLPIGIPLGKDRRASATPLSNDRLVAVI